MAGRASRIMPWRKRAPAPSNEVMVKEAPMTAYFIR
jgi:hypothetical protein